MLRLLLRPSLAGVLLLLSGLPAQARAMYGKAAVVVRDRITRAPLEGVRVTMSYAGPEQESEDSEKLAAKGNTGTTDAAGFATARVYVGRAQTRWEPFFGAHRQKQVDISAVRIRAEKTGYQPLEAVSRVFFVSFRKGEGTYVFLDELLLAPEQATETGEVCPTGFAPQANVEPAWGDFSTAFVLTARTRVPAVLAHEYSEPLLELVTKAPGLEQPVRLRDDGKLPDQIRNDGRYSAPVKFKGLSGVKLIEQLELHLDTVSSQHSLVAPGLSRISTGEGSPLLGGRKREKVVASLMLPVRWVVAETVEAARHTYEERWGTGASSGPTPTTAALQALTSRRNDPARTTPSRVQLVAVQACWSLTHYRTAAAFRAFVEALMRQVEARREAGIPCLVVFPEFIGLPLIFVEASEQLQGCTRWRDAGRRLIEKFRPGVEEQCRTYGVSPIRGLLLTRSETVRRLYTETFSRAAARHRCYLVAGSVPLPQEAPGASPDGRVYNTAFFFGPDGALLGTQKKAHPYGPEGTPEGFDLSPGTVTDVHAYATEFGNVGIAICYDSWQDGVMEPLAKQQAAIIVQPSANAHLWDDWQQGDWKKGLWQQLQRHAAFQYGVNPMMLGELFAPNDEYACDGQSAILTQTSRSPDGSGYLAHATVPPPGAGAQEQIVTATVAVDRTPG